MKVNITSGIYADNDGDFRTSYPKNYIPVPKSTNINTGYLKPGYGIVEFGSGSGTDRGGINWNGVHYRVMGTDLVKILEDGSNSSVATVVGTENVKLQYSFDYLSFLSNGILNIVQYSCKKGSNSWSSSSEISKILAPIPNLELKSSVVLRIILPL